MNSAPLPRVNLEKTLAERLRELLGSSGWDCSALSELRLTRRLLFERAPETRLQLNLNAA